MKNCGSYQLIQLQDKMYRGKLGLAKLRDSIQIQIGRPIQFDSKEIGRFKNVRIESAVPAPLLVVSLVKQLKPLAVLSGTVYRLASSMSDHTPVV